MGTTDGVWVCDDLVRVHGIGVFFLIPFARLELVFLGLAFCSTLYVWLEDVVFQLKQRVEVVFGHGTHCGDKRGILRMRVC
jgi:hypothetical protein